MAEVMNAAGFCSNKWIGYCCTQAKKDMEQIRVDKDEDVMDATVTDIMKRMFTRSSAPNSQSDNN